MPHVKMKTQGFTLLELMLVIVIITVMLVATLRTMQEKATAMKVQRAAQDIQSMLAAAQDYYLQNNTWPGTNIPPATESASDDLINNGFLAKIRNSPWATNYSLCPLISSGGATPYIASCPTKPAFSGPAANISFFVYFQVPENQSAFASEIAALVPNGINSCANGKSIEGNCQVQAQVVAPSGALNMAQYIKNATAVNALPYLSPATPTVTGPACTASSNSACWPPAASSPVPQILAPIGADCPTGWIPQIYTMPMGVASSALSYKDPTTGGYTLPPLSGFFVLPVARPTGATGSAIIGWDIYAAAIQEGGLTSTANKGAYVSVFTKCAPAGATTPP